MRDREQRRRGREVQPPSRRVGSRGNGTCRPDEESLSTLRKTEKLTYRHLAGPLGDGNLLAREICPRKSARDCVTPVDAS